MIPEDKCELVNTTVACDNKLGFDALISHWPSLIREVKIYPSSDEDILEELFASNVLVPGTDEAFDSFNEFLLRVDHNLESGNRSILGDKAFTLSIDCLLYNRFNVLHDFVCVVLFSTLNAFLTRNVLDDYCVFVHCGNICCERIP